MSTLWICGQNKATPDKPSGNNLCKSCLNKTGIANKKYKEQGYEYYCKIINSLISKGGVSECKYYSTIPEDLKKEEKPNEI